MAILVLILTLLMLLAMFILAKPITAIEPIREEVVMASRSTRYSETDIYWLSRIISAEAKGEPFEGMVAVGNVVVNRVASGWAKDIKEVIFQEGQFSPVMNGSINDDPTPDALIAAKAVLDGTMIVDKDILYFYNPQITKNKWMRTLTIVKQIGNHVFCKGK
jgi:N-acetylmuramoyl-L-alanine amidase